MATTTKLYAVPGSKIGVAWGNGSNATVGYYQTLFRELNANGISVAAATTGTAWSGNQIIAAAEELADLGCTRIVAAGHSQGAGGALRAAVSRPSLFNAVCAIMPAAQLPKYGKQPCFLIVAEHDLRQVITGSAYIAEKYRGHLLFAERKGISHYNTGDLELCRRVSQFAAGVKPSLSTRYWLTRSDVLG